MKYETLTSQFLDYKKEIFENIKGKDEQIIKLEEDAEKMNSIIEKVNRIQIQEVKPSEQIQISSELIQGLVYEINEVKKSFKSRLTILETNH